LKLYTIHPEILYLQLDGGSENANKWLLALLELLVAKRVVNEAWFSRLPVGHTHEDIDAYFGTIWKSFRSSPCLTLSEYKRRVVQSFKSSRVDVKDVYVVPDYKAVFEKLNCVDTNLSRLHKEDQTQHQWRFVATPISIHFPTGVKMTFRAYSSDCVVELRHNVAQQSCVTCIGQVTELEPVAVYSRWYPTGKCDPDRPVEGFYILRLENGKLPNWQLAFPNLRYFPPQQLPNNCFEDLRGTMNAIYSLFSTVSSTDVCREWSNWFSNYCPDSNDIQQYIDSKRHVRCSYLRPLEDVLFDDRFHGLDGTRWKYLSKLSVPDRIRTDIPQDLLALAMNSVSSDFNLHPVPPRIYLQRDVVLATILKEFQENTLAYYSHFKATTR
jgi:hypothetical protein